VGPADLEIKSSILNKKIYSHGRQDAEKEEEKVTMRAERENNVKEKETRRIQSYNCQLSRCYAQGDKK
jgi:hypothetical protein